MNWQDYKNHDAVLKKKNPEIDTEIKTPIISSISVFAAILFGNVFVQVCLLSFCREIVLKCIAKNNYWTVLHRANILSYFSQLQLQHFVVVFPDWKNTKGKIFWQQSSTLSLP